MSADTVTVGPLRPALASVKEAVKYLGSPSRAKFYADFLPRLESVKFGGRRMVVVASMDRLIAEQILAAKAPVSQDDPAHAEAAA